MLRLTVVRLAQAPVFAPVAVRGLAMSAPIYNKASKSGRKVRWQTSSSPPPAVATTTPGQAGTDVGQGGTGLFEGEVAPATSESAEPEIPTPDQIEREMLDAQKDAHATEDKVGRPNLAGSDVAHGGEPEAAPAAKADDGVNRFGPEEVVYTAAPTYNPALMLSLCLVMSVFSFSIADFARVGVEQYDEETGEYTNAPAWKRYLLAGGAATIGTSLVVAGVWAPTRNVVKITLREKAGSMRSTPFPQDSLLTLYNPLTPIAQKVLRQKPRSAPVSKIHLLGQLSETPKSYHPRTPGPAVEPKKGVRLPFSLAAAFHLASIADSHSTGAHFAL